MFVGRSSAVASDEMVEKTRADQRAEGRLAQLDRALDEVDRGDSVLAVHAHVVADDEGAVRPADEHRPVEPQLVDDRRHVVGPELAVGVVLGLERRLGHAVTAEVVGDEPELVGERALVLLGPAEVVLRPAVDEQDRRPVRLCPTRGRAAVGRRRLAPCASSSTRPLLRRRVTAVISRLLVLVGSRRSSPARSASASGECLIFRARAPYLPSRGTTDRAGDTGRMEARAGDVFVGRAGELGELGRALDATQAGTARPSSSPEKRASGRPGSRPSSRDAPATPVSRSCSGARSISSARSCRSSRSSRLCVRSESLAGRSTERARSCRCSRKRSRCSPSARLPRPCCSCSRIVHWADTSTLDLIVFLAHNLDDRRVLLLATYRADEPSSADRMRRLRGGRPALGLGARARARAVRPRRADRAARGPRRLSPVGGADGHDRRPLRGQPFFAEELLAAAGDERASFHVACATCSCSASPGSTAGRRACCEWRRPSDATSDTRSSARSRGSASTTCESRCAQAVEHGVLVAEQATNSFRFRHALLAEAIYATILPGEREELHARLADELARSAAATRPSSRPTGRQRVAAPRRSPPRSKRRDQAEAVFGLAEALAHLERALALWPAVPDAPELAGLDLAELCVLDSGARQPERARRRVRSSSHGEQSTWCRRATRRARRASTTASALPARERTDRRRPVRSRAHGRACAGAAALRGTRPGAGGARARVDARLALRRVAPRSASKHSSSPGRSAHEKPSSRRSGPRQRPRIRRPRRPRSRASPAEPRARREEQRSARASARRTSPSPMC